MQQQKSRLIIHATIAPQDDAQKPNPQKKRVTWRVLPRPRTVGARRRVPRMQPASVQGAASATKAARRTLHMRPRRTNGERLLRNTAIACTLLLGVTALTKIDTPWTRQVSQAVSSVVSMRVDLDESLGKLNFVRGWMPDAALVFWNMGASDALARPVAGALTHAYDAGQPWMEYQVSGEQPVYAADEGTVAALSESANGEWTLMIDHANGEQTVYAYLGKTIVKPGAKVEKGAQIGVTQSTDPARLYFELRVNGVSTDPTSRLRGA